MPLATAWNSEAMELSKEPQYVFKVVKSSISFANMAPSQAQSVKVTPNMYMTNTTNNAAHTMDLEVARMETTSVCKFDMIRMSRNARKLRRTRTIRIMLMILRLLVFTDWDSVS